LFDIVITFICISKVRRLKLCNNIVPLKAILSVLGCLNQKKKKKAEFFVCSA
jgi:hypothetical protein